MVEHKHQVLRRIIDTARQAGAADPGLLGRQIDVLFEGVTAHAVTLSGAEMFGSARGAARQLIDHAVSPYARGQADPGR